MVFCIAGQAKLGVLFPESGKINFLRARNFCMEATMIVGIGTLRVRKLRVSGASLSTGVALPNCVNDWA